MVLRRSTADMVTQRSNGDKNVRRATSIGGGEKDMTRGKGECNERWGCQGGEGKLVFSKRV